MAGLELRRLTKSFGDIIAVRELTLEVEDGELLVLVGPSGCGKSTTLRLVAGLDDPDSGEISIGGRTATRLPPAERDVAMVFQSYALFPHMSVFDNLAFGLAARKRPTAEIRETVTLVAESLGVTGLLDRKPRQLSGGERQRVALGRAMVRRPSIFLMDEPLSNLDAQLRVNTRAEIVRLQARLGVTTVYVTHDQTEALGMGHRVGVLRQGALQQMGTPREVYAAPANLFVASFIGSPPMNLVPVRRRLNGSLEWGNGSSIVPAPPGLPAVSGELVLGVRPEHVHVEGSRWSDGARRGEMFPATVDVVESAGDQVFIAMVATGQTLVARVEPTFLPPPGSAVTAWFDPDRLHVFDPATGSALAHPTEPE
jgi:multiple sugar transport system ATP-binding protein